MQVLITGTIEVEPDRRQALLDAVRPLVERTFSGRLDEAVELPMVGTGHSLNVAVAGSLVLYRLAGLI